MLDLNIGNQVIVQYCVLATHTTPTNDTRTKTIFDTQLQNQYEILGYHHFDGRICKQIVNSQFRK